MRNYYLTNEDFEIESANKRRSTSTMVEQEDYIHINSVEFADYMTMYARTLIRQGKNDPR